MDPRQNDAANTAVQKAAKRLDIPTKTSLKPFSMASVRRIEENDQIGDKLAMIAPNLIRGYIILGKSHTQVFRSYELYEQSGALLGKGPLNRRKTIRVPWEIDGKINLLLHGISGSQSFQFLTAP